MTRMVTRGALPGRLTAWMAVGVTLGLAGQARAEPLVSRFPQQGPPDSGATFGVVPASPAPAVVRQPARRAPRVTKLQELRELFLREHGAETMTLFFGYFGGFLPATPPATPPPAASPPSGPPLSGDA